MTRLRLTDGKLGLVSRKEWESFTSPQGQTGSGIQTASYPEGTTVPLPRGQATEANSWPISTRNAWVKISWGYTQISHISSWREQKQLHTYLYQNSTIQRFNIQMSMCLKHSDNKRRENAQKNGSWQRKKNILTPSTFCDLLFLTIRASWLLYIISQCCAI
jgi:hypothetical protein